jgi:hypothetical protein
LKEFSEKLSIPYPLLSDIDSRVIHDYGIANTSITSSDGLLFGIPFPGVYVTDEQGIVVAKFFHDTYKKRDSPEILIDAALGHITLDDDTPRVDGGDDEVRISATLHGGKGTIRQGIMRQLVVRFELSDGLHIYGEPVPDGMIPTCVNVEGPPGLVIGEPLYPPTTPLRLESLDLELAVWSRTVDIAVPLYAVGELASETRPLDTDSITLEVTVRYQACSDEACLLPKSEKLTIELPMDVIDVPALSMHQGHGQREAVFSGMPHALRLLLRKARKHPLGLLSYFARNIKLELAAIKRRRENSAS